MRRLVVIAGFILVTSAGIAQSPPVSVPAIVVPSGSGAVEQTVPGTRAPAVLAASFDGLGAGFTGPQGSAVLRNPSDNSLAVGPNHIVQTVNTRMAIFTKKGAQFDTTGRPLYGPVPTNTVFKGFGGACESRNNGDAVVRYDQLADRWLIVMPVFSRSAERPDQPGMADQVKTFGRPLGPVPPSHGRTNGIILRHGYIVAEFGDTNVVEPTYSVAKSYLSTIAGLTVDRGMIKSITDPVRNYIKDGGYDSPHNSVITWDDHLRQASEWEGTMFGKVSTFIGHEEFGDGEMKPREIRRPGTYYEYNDVRVNRLSLSLLRLWKRPLGDVLKTEIMSVNSFPAVERAASSIAVSSRY